MGKKLSTEKSCGKGDDLIEISVTANWECFLSINVLPKAPRIPLFLFLVRLVVVKL